MRQLLTPREDIAREAAEAFKQGRYGRGALSTVEDIPLFGGIARQAEEDIRSGNVGGLAGTATMMTLPEASELLPAKAKVGPIVSNVNNAAEEAALRSVEPHVPMSVGQRTGQRGVQRAEQALENFPGSASRAHQARAATEEALAKRSGALAAQAGGVRTNPYGAGKAIQQRLQARINRLKGHADSLYNSVRQDTAANKQSVQTGTTTIPGSNPAASLTPAGMPRTVPVMSTLETPVALDPIRKGLTPIYEDLKRALPDARRANSPAWRSLEELMTSDKTHMNAMDFDKTLSAVKSLARDGDSPFLSTQSQRVAKQIIANGEAEFQKAMAGAGPNTVAKLKQARNAVRAYHDTAELLGDLNDEPARLYSNLVTGGDRTLDTLKELHKVAPSELKTVGRTYLEGMVEKATNEGGFGRSAGIKADWQRLGPETKELLFGKQLTKDMDNFMLAAKRLTTERNPSGTAHMTAALGGLGAAGAIVHSLFTGSPAEAATAAGGLVVAPNVAARLLLTPGGAKLMTQTLTLPVRTPAWTAAVANLAGMAAEEQRKERKPNPWQVPPLPQ
jgi:hypothetical protein